MKLMRLRFSQEASDKLSQLKGRTGLTPNILARIGFSMSLNDPTIPNPDDFPPDGDKEIDRQVLLGQWDALFVALLKERCNKDGFASDDEQLIAQFRAHMNRGVLLLHKRIRTLKDLSVLMPREICGQAEISQQED
jgi:DNA sulfur modification protein DndE